VRIAVATIVRWYTTIPSWESSIEIEFLKSSQLDNPYYEVIGVEPPNELQLEMALRMMFETAIQTALAWFGISWLARSGFPIRFLNRTR
jgi:hypothetical protein